MLRRNVVGLLVCIATLGLAAFGYAGIPDLNQSTATTAAAATVSVYNLPDGTGARLDHAQLADGSYTDATITVTVLDGTIDPITSLPDPQPVFLYPSEDIWLETTLGGLKACPGGSTADFSTNINGVTVFATQVAGGGFSDAVAGEQTVVVINGGPLVGSNLDILFNGPDLTGDGIVNISDGSAYGAYLAPAAPYDYAGDLYYDGVINLSDMVLFAAGIGVECP